MERPVSLAVRQRLSPWRVVGSLSKLTAFLETLVEAFRSFYINIPRHYQICISKCYFSLLCTENLGRNYRPCMLLLLLLLYYFAKPVQHHAKDPYIKVDHNTGVYDPYSLRTVCGFFNVPQY